MGEHFSQPVIDMDSQEPVAQLTGGGVFNGASKHASSAKSGASRDGPVDAKKTTKVLKRKTLGQLKTKKEAPLPVAPEADAPSHDAGEDHVQDEPEDSQVHESSTAAEEAPKSEQKSKTKKAANAEKKQDGNTQRSRKSAVDRLVDGMTHMVEEKRSRTKYVDPVQAARLDDPDLSNPAPKPASGKTRGRKRRAEVPAEEIANDETVSETVPKRKYQKRPDPMLVEILDGVKVLLAQMAELTSQEEAPEEEEMSLHV